MTMSSMNTVLLSLVLLGCLFATSFSLPQEKITKDHNKKADIEAMFEFDDTLGIIQKLRNAVVAPTGMGKNYGRIMPLLRQG